MKKKIIIGIIILLIVTGIGTIIGLYYIGDYMFAQIISTNIDERAKSKEVENLNQPANIDERVEKLVGNANIGEQNQTEEQFVTVKDLKKVKDNIPKVEKVKIAATAFKKLNHKEISELKNKGINKIYIKNDNLAIFESKEKIDEFVSAIINNFYSKLLKNLSNESINIDTLNTNVLDTNYPSDSII